MIVLALAALPVLAGAQRGVNVRGERAGDVGGRGFSMPRAAELEDHSPVGVVLDRRKKLALSDSQLTALKAIATGLREKNADFYRMWDSVRVSMRAASGAAFGGGSTASGGGGGRGGRGGDAGGGAAPSGMTAADQERLATARTHSAAILRAIREGDAWSRQETLKVLTAEQKAKVEEFWKADDEDFRGGLPGGGRPPGS